LPILCDININHILRILRGYKSDLQSLLYFVRGQRITIDI